MALAAGIILGVVVGAAVLAASSLPLHANGAAPGELLFEFGEEGVPDWYEWELHDASSFHVGPRGEVAAYSHGSGRVQVFHPNGTFDFAFNTDVHAHGGHVLVGHDGRFFMYSHIESMRTDGVKVFHPNGTFDFAFAVSPPNGRGLLDVGFDGAVAILGYDSPARVDVYHPNGTLDFQLDLGDMRATWMAVGPGNIIAVRDYDRNTVKVYHPNGTLVDTLQFLHVERIDFGPTGELFVQPLNRIYHPNGTLAAKLHRNDGFPVYYQQMARFGPTGDVVALSGSSAYFAVFNGIEPTDDLRPTVGAPPPWGEPPAVVIDPPPAAVPPLAMSLAGAAYAFEFGSLGSGAGQFMAARDVAFGPGGIIAVADTGSHHVQVFHPNGTFAYALGALGEGPGEFYYPEGLAFGPGGLLAVSDMGNSRVQVFRLQ